jgi:ribonuclease P protein component
VWRLSGRRHFDALRREGDRARRGPIAVLHRPTDGPHPRIAFALSRDLGSAVARNRLRRRLRAVCRDLERDGRLPAGDYLVRAGAEALALDPAALADAVGAAVAAVARDRAAGTARAHRPEVER